ncbi:MAG: cysteine dioxygenase family protein [Myxococcota bacterium]
MDALQTLVQTFVGSARGCLPGPASMQAHPRALLNDPEDDFQIVLSTWAPGRVSPIHAHGNNVGVVAALVGETVETKFERRAQGHGRVELRAQDRTPIGPGSVSPLLPNDTDQVHRVANASGQWATTVHVYMNTMLVYEVYPEPYAGSVRSILVPLHFDARRLWRQWARPRELGAFAPMAMAL